MNHPKKISVVFSVFNESESLVLLFENIKALVNKEMYFFEFIFVDDGSTDNGVPVIRSLKAGFSHPGCTLKLVRFSRNYGHEAAMIAGIDYATGDAVICMDADLQHPLELIPEMVAQFEAGKQIVTMVRQKNIGISVWNGFLSQTFYRLVNRISANKLHENASDFFLVSKQVAEILRHNFRERNRFLRGIIQVIGFENATIEFTAPARVAGKTKYSFAKLLAVTARAITSFSNAPLFLGIWFGFIFALVSIVLGIYTLWIYVFGTVPPSGYTTIVLFMSIAFSILFFLIGIIGVYVGFIFDEQKKWPVYLVEEIE